MGEGNVRETEKETRGVGENGSKAGAKESEENRRDYRIRLVGVGCGSSNRRKDRGVKKSDKDRRVM